MLKSGSTSWMEVLGSQIISPRKTIIRKESELYIKIVGGILIYVGIAMIYIWIHLHNISMGYTLARINRSHDELLQRKCELQIEWEMLRAPQRIAWIAEQELGMILPEPNEMVIIK